LSRRKYSWLVPPSKQKEKDYRLVWANKRKKKSIRKARIGYQEQIQGNITDNTTTITDLHNSPPIVFYFCGNNRRVHHRRNPLDQISGSMLGVQCTHHEGSQHLPAKVSSVLQHHRRIIPE